MHEPSTLGRVLAIDDDELYGQVLVLTLEGAGAAHVTLVADGVAALSEIDSGSEPFDLIVSDLQMPHLDGIALIRELGARKYRGAIALLSGFEQRVLDMALDLGATHRLNIVGTLSKPVTREALLALPLAAKRHSTPSRASSAVPTADELQGAIERREITLHFQPKVGISQAHAPAGECLARWIHPERGFISPGLFVPLAEEAGLIDRLTDLIVALAVEQAVAWDALGFSPTLSLNLSMDNLHDLQLPDRLATTISSAGLTPARFVLEVTESRLSRDIASAMDILLRLRLRGFSLSIDDFGTGYSSLDQLRRAPFSELKLDRSFIHGVHLDQRRHAIVEASVTMARRLGLRTVAEGVEERADFDVLRHVGCDQVQGYFASRPLPATDFLRWYHEHSWTMPA